MPSSASGPVGAARRGVALMALVMTAVAAGSAGCATSPVRTISSSSAADQIAAQLRSRYVGAAVTVRCPGSVPARAGTDFSCPATVDGQAVAIDATVTGSQGTFVIDPASPILGLADVAARLQAQIAARVATRPAVRCPPPAGSPHATVRVAPVGSRFGCTAVFTGQAPRPVTVTVLDHKGDFSFSLPAGA